jgi:hypothetical protein
VKPESCAHHPQTLHASHLNVAPSHPRPHLAMLLPEVATVPCLCLCPHGVCYDTLCLTNVRVKNNDGLPVARVGCKITGSLEVVASMISFVNLGVLTCVLLSSSMPSPGAALKPYPRLSPKPSPSPSPTPSPSSAHPENSPRSPVGIPRSPSETPPPPPRIKFTSGRTSVPPSSVAFSKRLMDLSLTLRTVYEQPPLAFGVSVHPQLF